MAIGPHLPKGCLQPGTVTQKGRLPYVPAPITTVPHLCLDSLSLAILPAPVLAVYSINFCLLCSALGDFFHNLCAGPKQSQHMPELPQSNLKKPFNLPSKTSAWQCVIQAQSRKGKGDPFLGWVRCWLQLGGSRSPRSGNQVESTKLKPLNVNLPSRDLKPKNRRSCGCSIVNAVRHTQCSRSSSCVLAREWGSFTSKNSPFNPAEIKPLV